MCMSIHGTISGSWVLGTERTNLLMLDISLHDNIDFTRSGEVLNKETECAKSAEWCLPLEKPENIVGIQGQLWSETVRTGEQLDYMIFPRIIALAERAWHKADWESSSDKTEREAMRRDDWESFALTLGYKELKRLEELQIKYRVSLPGARIVDGKLEANTGYPGETIQYSTDGSTWNTFTSSPSTSSPSGTIYLRTISSTGRASRQIQIEATVPPVPFYKEVWFISSISIIALLILLVCLVFCLKNASRSATYITQRMPLQARQNMSTFRYFVSLCNRSGATTEILRSPSNRSSRQSGSTAVYIDPTHASRRSVATRSDGDSLINLAHDDKISKLIDDEDDPTCDGCIYNESGLVGSMANVDDLSSSKGMPTKEQMFPDTHF
ncbi:unnamed protein product [Owenia fusiformis]|uniref:beta-N-acetylhexosaminidase n=1 Tax=Owenia fusiformis TaxID=6347 RepID=A0A8J1XVR6_OWEFU|nr:unnamed protein product [Owenia fusiformis]